MAMRFHTGLLALSLTLLAGSAFGDQVCKYDSIRATAPASRFKDNGNGTVTDKATGLQWKRCSEGQTWSGGTCTGTAGTYPWQQALQRADAATYAGKSDWRLPNVKELASIVERACYRPASDINVFPGVYKGWYCSSSPGAAGVEPWSLDFSFGYGAGATAQEDDPCRVRLVRGGQ